MYYIQIQIEQKKNIYIYCTNTIYVYIHKQQIMFRKLIGKIAQVAKSGNSIARKPPPPTIPSTPSATIVKDHATELENMMEKLSNEIPNPDETIQTTYTLEEIEQKANEGDIDCQYHWGLTLQHGRDGAVESNPRKALELMANAAKHGHPWARYSLANAYLSGVDNVLKPDLEMSFRLFKACTESKSTEMPGAFPHVGNMYQHGLGVEKNEDKAIQYFNTAADMGDDNSKRVLKEIAMKLQQQDIENNETIPEHVSKEQIKKIENKMNK